MSQTPLINVMDEVELAQQYAAYKKQFEEWKDKNRNHPDRTAYNQYIEQWEKWERQVEQRRQQIRSLKQHQTSDVRKMAGGSAADSTSNANTSLSYYHGHGGVNGQTSTKVEEAQRLFAPDNPAPANLPAGGDMNALMASFMSVMGANPMMMMNSLMSMMPNALLPMAPVASAPSDVLPGNPNALLMEAFTQFMGAAANAGVVEEPSSSSTKKKDKDRKKKRKHHRDRSRDHEGRKHKRSRSSSQSKKRSVSRSRSKTPPTLQPAPRNWDKILDIEKHLDDDLKERLRMRQHELDFLEVDKRSPAVAKSLVDVHQQMLRPSIASVRPVVDFSRPPPTVAKLGKFPLTLTATGPAFPPPAIGNPVAAASSVVNVNNNQTFQQQFIAALSQAAAASSLRAPISQAAIPSPASAAAVAPQIPAKFAPTNRGFAGFAPNPRARPQERSGYESLRTEVHSPHRRANMLLKQQRRPPAPVSLLGMNLGGHYSQHSLPPWQKQAHWKPQSKQMMRQTADDDEEGLCSDQD